MFDDLIFDALIFDTQEIEVIQRVYPTKFIIRDIPRILIEQVKQAAAIGGKSSPIETATSKVETPTRPVTKTRRNGHIFSE